MAAGGHRTRTTGGSSRSTSWPGSASSCRRCSPPRTARSSAGCSDGLGTGVPVGLRIDHPDGLADPGGYLDALADATGGAYVVVEKILQHGEKLPPRWATAGTTGYDALAEIDRVFVDPDGRAALEALDASLRPRARRLGRPHPRHARASPTASLHAEVRRLAARRRARGGRRRTLRGRAERTAGVLPRLPQLPPVRARAPRRGARRSAAHGRPDLARRSIGSLRARRPGHPAAIRFQQTSGMVMAKGIEDTPSTATPGWSS